MPVNARLGRLFMSSHVVVIRTAERMLSFELRTRVATLSNAFRLQISQGEIPENTADHYWARVQFLTA